MLTRGPYVPYPSRFPEQLAAYCQQIADVVRQGGHHDQRRHLLLDFLRVAFHIDTKEVTLERKIRFDEARGRIDALWRHLIIEVKSNFDEEREDALAELEKYFGAQKHPGDYIALLTDGLRCELFTCHAGEVKSFKTFTLTPDAPVPAFYDLDQLLFTAKDLVPTPDDIVARFGLHSTVFNQTEQALLDLLQKVDADPMVKTKFREWNALLSKVYGSELGTKTLFVRHTYLTMLSRLFVVAALFPKELKSRSSYAGLADGRFFLERNLANLAEPDFFSWPLGTPVKDVFAKLLENLAQLLKIYDFDHLSGDILKELYQELVDPVDRHELGEYYTPDWLAALTLEALDYHGGRLLDPSCGSGSFLFAAVERLRASGHEGTELAQYVSDNLIGIDVHPVAVLMAKANLVLALRRELRNFGGDLYLRVYLADTLMTEERSLAVTDVKRRNAVFVQVDEKNEFRIPNETQDQVDLDDLIDNLARLAKRIAAMPDEKTDKAKILQPLLKTVPESDHWIWQGNFSLMVKLEREHRNSIWAYILKNAYRPVYLRQNKVDFIAGNPPWLRYSDIKEPSYKDRVRELILGYGLVDKSDQKLFTAMELATLFFIHCEQHFLKSGGKIGFVLPKSCIVPSKQHAAFQKHQFSQVHDFTEVEPLFNVRTCMLVRGPRHRANQIPATYWSGRLSGRNTSWKDAKDRLASKKGAYTFHVLDAPQSPYYEKFLAGATLYPRTFVFVEPAEDRDLNLETPYVHSSRDLLVLAKKPWTMRMEGRMNKEYLFASALADDLVPFGIRRLRLCVLPLSANNGIKFTLVEPMDALTENKIYAHDWFLKTATIFLEKIKDKKQTLANYLNYGGKLLSQNPKAKNIVLYNAAGTNLSATLFNIDRKSRVDGLSFEAFVADHKHYRYYAKSEDEGYFLVGVLNSSVANEMIKPFQTQGLLGERDIHRRPFEVCPIPLYNPKDKLHRAIAAASRAATERLEPQLPSLPPRLADARASAREILHHELGKLDQLTRELFAARPAPDPIVAEAAGQYHSDKTQSSLAI